MFQATRNISQEENKVITTSISGEVLSEEAFASEEEANAAFWVEFNAINADPDLRVEVFGTAKAQVSERV